MSVNGRFLLVGGAIGAAAFFLYKAASGDDKPAGLEGAYAKSCGKVYVDTRGRQWSVWAPGCIPSTAAGSVLPMTGWSADLLTIPPKTVKAASWDELQTAMEGLP